MECENVHIENISTSLGAPTIHAGRTRTEPLVDNYITKPLHCSNHGEPDNQTRKAVAECVAKLEETKHCLMFPSGMSAVRHVFALVKKGEHVIAQQDSYHSSIRLLRLLKEDIGDIELTFVDAVGDLNDIAKALKPNTKLVWVESPTNPLFNLVDLKAVASLVKSKNPSAIVSCDNSIMTPYFQQPATLGVDVVINSCTKYLCGHADILLGAVCTNNAAIYQEIKEKQKLSGAVPSLFDCSLLFWSLETLEIRMERHMKNGLEIVQFLQNHPRIENLFHTSMKSHPQWELSQRQTRGHSGIISFRLQEADGKYTCDFLKRLKLIKITDNFGVAATTAQIPYLLPDDEATKMAMIREGITRNLIRLSVGLENHQDIINDLEQALNIE